jgi:hypothetical protein
LHRATSSDLRRKAEASLYLNIPEKADINKFRWKRAKHGLERRFLDVAAQDDIVANCEWHWYADPDNALIDEMAD